MIVATQIRPVTQTSIALESNVLFKFAHYFRRIGCIEFSLDRARNEVSEVPISAKVAIQLLLKFLTLNTDKLESELTTPQIPDLNQIRMTLNRSGCLFESDTLACKTYKAFQTLRQAATQLWIVKDLPAGGMTALKHPPLFTVALESDESGKLKIYAIFLDRKKLEKLGLLDKLSDFLIENLAALGIKSNRQDTYQAQIKRPKVKNSQAWHSTSGYSTKVLGRENSLRTLDFSYTRPSAKQLPGAAHSLPATMLVAANANNTPSETAALSFQSDPKTADLPEWVRTAPQLIIDSYRKARESGGILA